MSKTTIVGCDLHSRSMLLRYAVDTAAPVQRSFRNDADGRAAMMHFLVGFARDQDCGRIVFVYEASGQGYGLHDQLTDCGIECYVLSPTHLPRTAKSKRNKTDAKDAQMLLEQARGFVLAGNKLPIVWTPPQALRDDRELVRCRLETAESLTRVKLQIFSFLKRHAIALPTWFQTNRGWTRAFASWLQAQATQMPAVVGPVLSALVERTELLKQQITELNRHLRKLAKTPRYAAGCEALCELVGVGQLTAMTFLTEMGDLNRFSNRRQVAAYLGLCPSSFESGDVKDRKGHITRQGPSRVRKVLCQAAWAAIRMDTETHLKWERIRGGSSRRGKKAAVAIMRRLAIRMWHTASQFDVASELVQRVTPPPRWTSAQAQQKGPVPSASPPPRPLASTG